MESSWSGHPSNEVEPGPGQALCIPRGAVHRFDNFGSEDVKQLCLISPAVMGPAYFREAAEAIGAAAHGPLDREKMREMFRRHGMTIVAPPPAKYWNPFWGYFLAWFCFAPLRRFAPRPGRNLEKLVLDISKHLR